MKFHRSAYVLRPGGIAYAKLVAFMDKRRGKRAGIVYAYETLVRSARTGRLLRVERPGKLTP
jgi:hypothetical protein